MDKGKSIHIDMDKSKSIIKEPEPPLSSNALHAHVSVPPLLSDDLGAHGPLLPPLPLGALGAHVPPVPLLESLGAHVPVPQVLFI
jgi:hypothetical protein